MINELQAGGIQQPDNQMPTTETERRQIPEELARKFRNLTQQDLDGEVPGNTGRQDQGASGGMRAEGRDLFSGLSSSKPRLSSSMPAGSAATAQNTSLTQQDLDGEVPGNTGRQDQGASGGMRAEGRDLFSGLSSSKPRLSSSMPAGSAATAQNTSLTPENLRRLQEGLMSGSGNGSGAQTGNGGKEGMSELSSIFSGLMSAQGATAPAVQTAPAVEAQQGPAVLPDSELSKLQEMCSSMVERILVSDPSSTAGSRLIMQMSSSSPLAGTEILMTRSNDGTLAVVINAGSKEQYRLLNDAREKLENRLERLEKGMFTVQITQPEDS